MNPLIQRLIIGMAVIFLAGQGWASLSWSAMPEAIIPDNRPDAGVASDIYITPGDPQLSGVANPGMTQVVSVQFTIVGGWDGDYQIVLSHTDGAASESVTLVSMILNGAGANGGFDQVTLAAGGADINSAGSAGSTAAITGTWAPQGGVDFSSFQNISPAGDWVLYVTDCQSGDQGTLANWSLVMDVVPEPVPEALVIFAGLAGILALARARRGNGL